MIKTRLTEEYGITIPIVAAGMAFYSLPELVTAVSNAGGMGTLAAGMEDHLWLKEQLLDVQRNTTKPYAVDFITEYTSPEHIQVCLEMGVKIAVFHWGHPPKDYIKTLQQAGCRVWEQVGSTSEALSAVDNGVNLIIAQGAEAGGHVRSQASLFSLLPSIVDAVGGQVPVLAAGGIADGRGLAAALALGAQGVWIGTRFAASTESYAHEEFKQRVVAAGVEDTAVNTLFGPEWPDQPNRAIKNRALNTWLSDKENALKSANPNEVIGETIVCGNRVKMPKSSVFIPTADTSGDFEEMALMAGESAGLIREIKPAGQIVKEMQQEAESIIKNHQLTR